MRVTKFGVLLLEWAPPPPRTQFDCEILRFFGTAQNHVGSNVVEMLKFLQFCPLSTIPGSKNFWSRNCAQFPKKVELCSIPVPWAQGILVSTGNRAQFQVELWMGIELKGRNCGWELSSRDGIAEIYGSSQLEYLWQSQRFIVKREEITWSQGMGIELNSPVETHMELWNYGIVEMGIELNSLSSEHNSLSLELNSQWKR